MLKQLKKNISFEKDIFKLIDELAAPEVEGEPLPFLGESSQKDLDVVDSQEHERPFRMLRKRLNEYDDEDLRDTHILRLSDPIYSEQDIALYMDYLEKIKKSIQDLIKSVDGQKSFVALNQLLKSFEQYNEALETLKGLDEDIFIAAAIRDSEMPYSEAFADAILRMRLDDEETSGEDEEKKLHFEKEITLMRELLASDDEESFSDTIDEFEEELLIDHSFQKCLLNQKKN